MHRTLIPSIAAACFVAGCGASYPVPTQQLADTESAERSAAELGAANEPKAQLHLQLAQEQLTQAKVAIAGGDNGRASVLLTRARSDAELAIALTRAGTAKAAAQAAIDQANAQKATNSKQGGQ
ncbi:MAG TPA: DUF4398 domain-containing protein [Polyangiaceae bacterium]